MICNIVDCSKVWPLFGDWQETLIWSCLQGVMGTVYGNHWDHPTAAMAVIGDFIFFSGEPSTELLSYRPAGLTKEFMIMVPQNEPWQKAITQFYGERAKIISRYAIKKEANIFDKRKLEHVIASLPESYRLAMMDEHLYHMCKEEAWSADLVSQFEDYESYSRLGLGAVICHHHRLVSGASSYSRYKEGIEIEIDTKEEYRRQGLAYVCGAKLILECLKRNLYPSWDAHNKGSVALAEKLGYHYSHAYTAVEVCLSAAAVCDPY